MQQASILIPSPNVTGDQQRKNAALLKKANAAIVIEDALAFETLPETVEALITKEGRKTLQTLAENVKTFAVKDCEKTIYGAIRELIDSRK